MMNDEGAMMHIIIWYHFGVYVSLRVGTSPVWGPFILLDKRTAKLVGYLFAVLVRKGILEQACKIKWNIILLLK